VANKTYRVAKLLHKVNTLCKNPDVDWQAKRMVCALLSDVLHDTDNYEGFGYNVGFETKEDEYNRSYYVSPALQAEYRELSQKSS
jgi:hypothetical protein